MSQPQPPWDPEGQQPSQGPYQQQPRWPQQGQPPYIPPGGQPPYPGPGYGPPPCFHVASWLSQDGGDVPTGAADAAAEVVSGEPPLFARWLATNETTTTAPMPARMFRTQCELLLRCGGCCGGP